jgi:hypothetical protein
MQSTCNCPVISSDLSEFRLSALGSLRSGYFPALTSSNHYPVPLRVVALKMAMLPSVPPDLIFAEEASVSNDDFVLCQKTQIKEARS